MKSSVRSCKRWSELLRLLYEAHNNDMVSGKSFIKIRQDLRKSDRDDTSEFEKIRKEFSIALSGKAIMR